jgi:mono/diheme cytochrome c family protein
LFIFYQGTGPAHVCAGMLVCVSAMERRNTASPSPVRGRAARAALIVFCAGSALALGSLIAGAPDSASAQGTVQFDRDVWPILKAKCVTCHGPEDHFNELRLDSKDAILKGGKNGKILTPGDPTKSPMYVRVSLPPDDLDIMPAEGDPLTAAQIDTIKRWIAEGADFGSWVGVGG